MTITGEGFALGTTATKVKFACQLCELRLVDGMRRRHAGAPSRHGRSQATVNSEGSPKTTADEFTYF